MSSLNKVYLVWHSYSQGGQDDEEVNSKLLGVFGTAELAHARVDKASQEPGFSAWPDGFVVDEYEVDRDHWVDGFSQQ